MEHVNPNPIFVGFLFLLRCLVPLVILFAISYLLRRLGVVAETPAQPQEGGKEAGGKDIAAAENADRAPRPAKEKGGAKHGKA